jgi:hypothetical protein
LPHSRPIAYGASGGIIVVLGGTIVSVEMGASEPSTSNSSSDEESQSSSLERIILAKYPKSMLVVAPYMVFHIGTTVVGPYVSWKIRVIVEEVAYEWHLGYLGAIGLLNQRGVT